MNRQTSRLPLAAFAFVALLPSGIAAAQSVPGLPPSIGQEIDRALSQVPDADRRAAPGRPTVGQDIDQLLHRPNGQATALRSRQVSLAFENKTEVKALVIQFTPSGATSWGPNRLARETLNPGAWMRWRANGTDCRYDVRVTFALGQEFVRLDHDFCAQEKIEIKAEEASAERAALPARDGVALFRVVNRTDQRVAVLRVSPAGARRPQGDLLGIWMMEPGDVYTGRVPRGGACLFDLRAGFDPEETDTVTLARQNLCETPEIVIPARRSAGG
ncbi:MAG: hypothetical protein K2X45_15030 [Phreatobacter sp.]|nr:hypothetical protein [Phreatobacter sp.]